MTKFYAIKKVGAEVWYSRRLGTMVNFEERDIFAKQAKESIDLCGLEDEMGARLEWKELVSNPKNWVYKYHTAGVIETRSKPYVFLNDGGDYTCFHTITEAVESYRTAAQELARYGQEHSATLHLANCRDEIAEYPDWVLTLGKRGAVQRTKA